jgi:hypothetical protein
VLRAGTDMPEADQGLKCDFDAVGRVGFERRRQVAADPFECVTLARGGLAGGTAWPRTSARALYALIRTGRWWWNVKPPEPKARREKE